MSEQSRARGIAFAEAVARLRRGVVAIGWSIVIVGVAGLLLSLTR